MEFDLSLGGTYIEGEIKVHVPEYKAIECILGDELNLAFFGLRRLKVIKILICIWEVSESNTIQCTHCKTEFFL